MLFCTNNSLAKEMKRIVTDEGGKKKEVSDRWLIILARILSSLGIGEFQSDLSVMPNTVRLRLQNKTSMIAILTNLWD